MSMHSQSNRSWRAARNIRRISELATHEMATIDPRWPLFESAEMDLDATDLRPLLDVPALAPSHGIIALTILSIERRPARDVASAAGTTQTCISRWVSLGRDVSPTCAGRLVELARCWPVQ